jgi:hypothetical protein
MALDTMLDASRAICAYEFDCAADDTAGQVRKGYESRRMQIFDVERGVTTTVASFRPPGEFYSPRHSHFFSHVRYVVSGEISYGTETARAGDCTLVSDGVPYGPLRPGEGDLPHFLQIDFMGPSGTPNIAASEMRAAIEELSKTGSVDGGVYKPFDGGPEQETYLAAMSQILKRPVPEVKPLLRTSPTVHTNDLPWSEHAPGVWVKHIAFLFDIGPNVKLVRLAPGATLPGGNVAFQQARYLIEGEVDWDGIRFEGLSMMFYPPNVDYPATTGVADESVILVAQWANVGEVPPPFALL